MDASADQTGDKRVQFDFEIEFSNGGGLQGQGFRLDIYGDDIDDASLGDYIVHDLRLLMVEKVRILNKQIITEQHKRGRGAAPDASTPQPRLIDLSHTIEHEMVTYQGLPGPLICDYLSRERSRAMYADGTEFQIGKIEMVANTGTYLDSPFHRFPDGKDLSQLSLDQVSNLEGSLVRVTGMSGRAVTRPSFAAVPIRGKAVLVHTGWAEHWGTDRYFEGHPFLTGDAAAYLRDEGALLVGIDSYNIDDTGDGRRPVHTTLLGADIPIVEHLRGLEALPLSDFRFSTVPVKVKGMGSFPVRAYAALI